MAINQTNKITWLVNTIHEAGMITFDEINRKWKCSEIGSGEDLSKRTFHKWIDAVLDTFGLIIENEKKGPYRYFIFNDSEIDGKGMENWLLNTFSVSNSLLENKQLKERIILENVPSGQKYLDTVIRCMKENRLIHIVYHSYFKDSDSEYEIEPYAVKLFRQRWYIIANENSTKRILKFSLDRIKNMSIDNPDTFIFPSDFSVDDYYRDSYGIIIEEAVKTENIRLKVSAGQANYIRDLRLHDSQKESERNEKYSIFELHLRPTFDFQQEILWNGEEMEVLEPLWLRKEIAGKISKMWNFYNEKEV